jgi:hypothetical protein
MRVFSKIFKSRTLTVNMNSPMNCTLAMFEYGPTQTAFFKLLRNVDSTYCRWAANTANGIQALDNPQTLALYSPALLPGFRVV